MDQALSDKGNQQETIELENEYPNINPAYYRNAISNV
jgi:hypothetical protein